MKKCLMKLGQNANVEGQKEHMKAACGLAALRKENNNYRMKVFTCKLNVKGQLDVVKDCTEGQKKWVGRVRT